MSRLTVLGAGESGVGAAVLAKKKNFEVFLGKSLWIQEKSVSLQAIIIC